MEGKTRMRFILGIVIVVALCLAALLIYGQVLEPDTRTIEVEVTPNAA
ncbi:MAG: hypothetical protein AAFU58_00190 [Pseudomonadota bacterium]